MTLNTTWSSAICYWCLRVPTFVGFALWPVVFELQAILSQVHRMSPKVTLDMIRSNIANCCMYYWCLKVSNISLFRSMTDGFRVTGHFATSAPNDTKMILNTTKYTICLTKVHSIHYIYTIYTKSSTRGSEILLGLLQNQPRTRYCTFFSQLTII